jgi:dynein heavy chain
MFEVKPVKKADPNTPGKKFDDYWEPSQKVVLADPKKLLDDLFEFDKDNIPERVVAKIDPYISREDFDPAAIKKASVACEALCMWCRAMHKYHFVALAVEPKRQMLAAAEADLAVTMAKLEKAQKELKQVEDKIAALEADFNAAVAKQDKLQADLDMCSIKLTNANKLINGLGGEKARWTETVEQLTHRYDLLPGDSLIAAGMVSYAGPFTGEYRKDFESRWLAAEDAAGLAHTPDTNLLFLGDPVRIQQWSVCGLPNDNLSVENGIIIDKARRWALMIDPQRQANKYIKLFGKVESQAGMDTCKLSDPNFLQTLELGIQFGKWVLLENIGEELDPALEPILQQQKVKDGSSWVIKLGDKQVNYDLAFRLFITTTLNNPHYSPETSVKVTLLNFAITPEGLQDQMLGIVVAKEQPEMEEKKQGLVKSNAAMNKQLKELEDEILRLLSQDGDILESKELIDTLEVSKKTSGVINKAMEDAKVTEVEIDEARKAYRDYAFRASLLFFCVQELTAIDPMYQFSLQWFQQLASMGIDNAPSGKDPQERLLNLIDFFTYSLYQSVCRGLFERHKLLFSLSLCIKIMAGDGKMDMSEFRFFLTGPTTDIDDGLPNPAPEWISPQAWNEVLSLSRLDTFASFDQSVTDNINLFKELYDTQEAENLPVPAGWEEKLTPLQKLCFLRTLRLDRVSVAILNFVQGEMGQHFVEPPVFNIAISYEDSTKISPLIFVLSSGSDPVADMLAFAEDMGMTKKLESISLGQGQGPKASRMIDSARASGGWVLLCNCHLSISWLPELERICEQLNPEETHNDYRLWLTSMPTKQFPALLLQNGVKMTNEPPKGLRANVLSSMSKMDDKMLNDCEQPSVYKKLIFSFCFFHAICQDRRKFGPIGWNIAYGFTMEDLITNRRQLKFFLDNYDYVPYPVLNYLGAKINYGGRVTDDKDKRLISTILEKYIHDEVITKGAAYKFSASGTYYCPEADCQEEFITYIRTLPIAPHPEVFGLDGNCEIACAEAEANSYLEGMLSMAPRASGGGGKSADAVMDEMALTIIEQTPKKFDLDDLEAKFPTMYSESRNTVLKQESFKYNRLLSLLNAQLPLFRRALKGLVVMTDELEASGKAMYSNMVPDSWAAKGFLSLKPLSAWIKDLVDRMNFMNSWVDNGNPMVFWLSGMFFPQAFLTATNQNFARKFKIAIDKISFDYVMHDEFAVDGSDVKEGVDFGCLCYGLFLEGCKWDFEKHTLASSLPKQLYAQMPLVHFKPVPDRQTPSGVYQCPVYKVLSRKGTLSTTGHSTNFVLYMDVPSQDEESTWIRAGVALFLALKY